MSPWQFRAYQGFIFNYWHVAHTRTVLLEMSCTHSSLTSHIKLFRTSFSSVMNDRYTPFKKLHWVQLWDEHRSSARGLKYPTKGIIDQRPHRKTTVGAFDTTITLSRSRLFPKERWCHRQGLMNKWENIKWFYIFSRWGQIMMAYRTMINQYSIAF